MANTFDMSKAQEPYSSYEEYMDYLFACVNEGLDRYLSEMKHVYATGQGGYKNVLYPDLEIAHDTCVEKLGRFRDKSSGGSAGGEGYDDAAADENPSGGGNLFEGEGTSGDGSSLDDAENEENGILSAFMGYMEEEGAKYGDMSDDDDDNTAISDIMQYIRGRAEITLGQGISLPYYEICHKLEFGTFTEFCLACGILSSTQTDYAGVFQVINENGSLPAPTIESAAKLYYGRSFSITGAYGDMSVCLEQLMPILDLKVQPSMPFSTAVSPDKRMIDYLFGKNPLRLDENYIRFFQMLTDGKEPVLNLFACQDNDLP